MKNQPSISTKLFLLLFVVGLGALLIGGTGLYLEVRELVFENMDQTLRSDAEILSGLLHVENGRLNFEHTEAATSQFSIPGSGHYYQILLDGKILAASASLAGQQLELDSKQMVAQEDRSPAQTTYITRGPAGKPLRALEKSLVMVGHPVRVTIAHSLIESYEMLDSLLNFLMLFGLIGTLLIAFLGWTISQRSLRPLRDFSTSINRISATTLDRRLDADNEYRELSSLAHAFNAMLKRLQNSLQMREELLSDVSHELKTPVTVIRSHCDIYLQRDRPAAEYREALEVIRETTDDMGLKIRRLLGFAQTAADLMTPAGGEPLLLDDCLRKACLTVEHLARSRRITINTDLKGELRINGHAERLIEAFSNLLENALKFNHRGGSVNISSVRQLQQVLIRIEDTGCGIDTGDLGHIFERFYRGKKSDSIEGCGLGLVLVKTIIEAHQGHIEVSSRPGEGSCFNIYLPVSPQA